MVGMQTKIGPTLVTLSKSELAALRRSLERRWVRSQHGLRQLLGHPPGDDSDEDTDDDGSDNDSERGEPGLSATNEEGQHNQLAGSTVVEVSDVTINVEANEGDANNPENNEIAEAATEAHSEEEQQTAVARDQSNADSDGDELGDYAAEDERSGSDSSQDSNAEEDSSEYSPSESDEEVSPSWEADALSHVEEITHSASNQNTRPNWDRDTASASEEDATEDSPAATVTNADTLEDWEVLSAGSVREHNEQPNVRTPRTPEPDARPEHQGNDNSASRLSAVHEDAQVPAPRQPLEVNQSGF